MKLQHGFDPLPPCLKETAELVGDGIPNHELDTSEKHKVESRNILCRSQTMAGSNSNLREVFWHIM